MTDATLTPFAPATPASSPPRARSTASPGRAALSSDARDTLVVLAGSALMAAGGVMLGCYLLLPFSGA